MVSIFNKFHTQKITLLISLLSIILYLSPPIQAAIDPGLNLTATYQSISIEVPNNAAATAAVEYKKKSDTTYKAGLGLWQAGGALYGSLVLLESNTLYDLRVTPQGGASLNGDIQTKNETLSPAQTVLNQTSPQLYYVLNTGNDTNDGKSSGNAWKTLEKAATVAPSGSRIVVGPGFYTASTTPFNNSVSLFAQFPATDDNRNVINDNNRSVIEYGLVSGPSNAVDPRVIKSPWQQVSLPAPGFAEDMIATGSAMTVWKWANSGVSEPKQLGYAQARSEAPQRVSYWTKTGAALSTPEGWLEKLRTNKAYNYGFTSFGQDIFLRLPGDVNPNNYYITVGGGVGSGFVLKGANSRVSGFEIRTFDSGIALETGSSGSVVDHNYLISAGIRINGNKFSSPQLYSDNHLIERNLIVDSTTWTDDSTAKPVIPWTFIKSVLVNADGTNYRNPLNNQVYTRIGSAAETTGIWGIGGSKNSVIRFNTVDGSFNGIGSYNVGFDKYASFGTDIHNNVIKHIADDAIEPESNAINWRVWSNVIESAYTFFSTGPANYGPLYIFKNSAVKLSDNKNDKYGQGVGFKYSGASSPQAKLFVVNNTFWTDEKDTANNRSVSGGDMYASPGSNPEAFYLRNNIFRFTRYAFNYPNNWDEDYNYFATTDAGRGLAYKGGVYTWSVPNYRTASSQGANTNILGNFTTVASVDNNFESITAGNYQLKDTSGLINKGAIIPNINDTQGVTYSGSAPDIGSFEYGLNQPAPKVGDLNNDQKVDIFDYNILLTNFGKSGVDLAGDIDNSGKVDIFDYNSLLTNFGF